MHVGGGIHLEKLSFIYSFLSFMYVHSKSEKVDLVKEYEKARNSVILLGSFSLK
mgnify:CR=1 FL=1